MNNEWQHLMYLNWQHLMYFLVAADTGNFTTAAEQMFITQSTLTKAMNNLETTLVIGAAAVWPTGASW